MKRNFVLCLLFFVLCPIWAQPSSEHYAGIDGTAGKNLFLAVSAAANQGYHDLTYGGLWAAYEQTDLRPGTRTIWDMYSDCSFVFQEDRDRGGSAGSECILYNREHTVPKSWWGGAESEQGSDIMLVVPTDKVVNAKRGNDPYGEVKSASWTSQNGSKSGSSARSGYSGTVFEPINEYKGDLARGILGTMTKWQGKWTKSGGSSTFNGTYTQGGNFGLTAYAVALFLDWHRKDPVSQKELDRNNGIEATQGNRNPFIDYPELVEYIWGNKQGETVHLSSLCSAYDTDCGNTDSGNDNGTTTEVPDGDYIRIVSALKDYSGVYLIVCTEAGKLMRDSTLSTATANSNIGWNNTQTVTIVNDSLIKASAEVNGHAFTIAPMAGGYSVQGAGGTYISMPAANNVYGTAAPVANTITVDAAGNAKIGGKDSNGDTRYIFYNPPKDDNAKDYFRYYKDSFTYGKNVQLYKRIAAGGTDPNEGTVEDGIEDIFFTESVVPSDLRVYDSTGRLILQQNDVTTLDVNLPSGLYIIQWNNTTKKIRIQ